MQLLGLNIICYIACFFCVQLSWVIMDFMINTPFECWYYYSTCVGWWLRPESHIQPPFINPIYIVNIYHLFSFIPCEINIQLMCVFVCVSVPATKLNTITKSNLGQCVSKYDLLVWFEISELEPTGEWVSAHSSYFHTQQQIKGYQILLCSCVVWQRHVMWDFKVLLLILKRKQYFQLQTVSVCFR